MSIFFRTNIRKTMYYIGVINNIARRQTEHREGFGYTYTSKNNIHYLIYFE